jgi:hypothetical protein
VIWDVLGYEFSFSVKVNLVQSEKSAPRSRFFEGGIISERFRYSKIVQTFLCIGLSDRELETNCENIFRKQTGNVFVFTICFDVFLSVLCWKWQQICRSLMNQFEKSLFQIGSNLKKTFFKLVRIWKKPFSNWFVEMEFVSQICRRNGLPTNRPYLSAPKNLGNSFRNATPISWY